MAGAVIFLSNLGMENMLAVGPRKPSSKGWSASSLSTPKEEARSQSIASSGDWDRFLTTLPRSQKSPPTISESVLSLRYSA